MWAKPYAHTSLKWKCETTTNMDDVCVRLSADEEKHISGMQVSVDVAGRVTMVTHDHTTRTVKLRWQISRRTTCEQVDCSSSSSSSC